MSDAPRRPRALLVLGALCVVALLGCGKDERPAAGAPEATAPEPAAPGAAPAAPTAEPAPAGTEFERTPVGTVLSDQWYEVRDDRRKSGWYHMVWTRSTWQGAPSIHDHTENENAETRVMAGMEDVFESRTVTDLERAEDGTLLSLRTEETIADRTTSAETRREADRYVFVQTIAGREERHEVRTSEPVPVDAEAFLAPRVRRGEIREGMVLTFPATNFEAGRLETVRLTVQARETIGTQTGAAACWRVLQTLDGRPGEQTWWIDENGVLARLRSGTLLVERTTEGKARTLDPSAAAYEITMPADPELPRTTSLERSVVDVTIRRAEGLDLPDFPATPYSHEVSRDGNTIRVELTAHDDPAATVRLPVAPGGDAALAKALEATNLYAPDHPKVRTALAMALRNVPEDRRADGRTVAAACARFVFATLHKASGPIPQPTAPEILDAGMGDCSEHAVLFVALCRAAGLPARRYSGYAQVGDMWGAHSFCEIWLGKWIGADPTTNEIGTRARYLCFGRDEDPDSYPGLVSSRCRGRMRIRTVDFTEDGTTMTVDDARVRKPLRDDLSGLVLAEPPEGWSARVSRAGSASITGPGTQVSVHVLAGMGDLDVSLLKGSQFPTGQQLEFCGQPALRVAGGFFGRGAVTWAVPWRRRTLLVVFRTDRGVDEMQATAAAESVLAPTLAPAATPTTPPR